MSAYNTAKQLTDLFYVLRGNDQPYKRKQYRDGPAYTKYVLGSGVNQAISVVPYEWRGRGRRPANTYRGARCNEGRVPSVAQRLKACRLALGVPRRQYDRMQSLARKAA